MFSRGNFGTRISGIRWNGYAIYWNPGETVLSVWEEEKGEEYSSLNIPLPLPETGEVELFYQEQPTGEYIPVKVLNTLLHNRTPYMGVEVLSVEIVCTVSLRDSDQAKVLTTPAHGFPSEKRGRLTPQGLEVYTGVEPLRFEEEVLRVFSENNGYEVEGPW